MLKDFLLIFLPLLVVVDAPGTLPLFLALTDHDTPEQRRVIARRATFVAAITGVLFIIIGQALLAFLGVEFADFQIAGGILLVVLAIVDLLTSTKPAAEEGTLRKQGDEGLSIVPLAIPVIVGPATLTTSLLLVNTYGPHYVPQYGEIGGTMIVTGMVASALVLNLLILFAVMWHSQFILRVVGRPAMTVVNKIVMILLAAIAVSLIRRGITSIVKNLH